MQCAFEKTSVLLGVRNAQESYWDSICDILAGRALRHYYWYCPPAIRAGLGKMNCLTSGQAIQS